MKGVAPVFGVLLFLFASAVAEEPERQNSFTVSVPSSLLGTWEGILDTQQLVHIELNDKRSFLVLVNITGPMQQDFKPWIYSLKSSSLEEQKVTLNFASNTVNEVTISGELEVALIRGTFQMSAATSGRKPNPWDVVLRKGTWTRNLSDASQLAENAIKKAQTKETIETGPFSNITIDNQTILQHGDWVPSAKQAWDALQKVQLFLEEPGQVNKITQDQIQSILTNKDACRVQFIGRQLDGKKLILCRFFSANPRHGREPYPNWKAKEVITFGADYHFWRIYYDPEKDECLKFEVDSNE